MPEHWTLNMNTKCCISKNEITSILNGSSSFYFFSIFGSFFRRSTESVSKNERNRRRRWKKTLNIQIVCYAILSYNHSRRHHHHHHHQGSLLLFRSFIQFPFYDNKFFIFVWKWKPTFNNLFCLQRIWCEVRSCSVSFALALACARLSLSVQVHFARHSHPKEPVIEKVRKHCFSDKGIALSTRMIYLVNISIVFSYDVEQYHMCLESTWIQA